MKILDIKQYLKTILKIETRNVSNDELIGLCPSPGHNDSTPSWYCNAKTGLHQCKSCGFRGNIEWLSKIILGQDQGKLIYDKCTGIEDNKDEYLKEKIKLITNETSIKKEVDLDSFKYYIDNFNKVPYIENSIMSKIKNFISPPLVKTYNIKHWTIPGNYYNRIAIPIYDFDGNIQNISLRKINKEDKNKYMSLPSSCTQYKQDDLLFLNKCLITNSKINSDILVNKLPYLIVTEGIFDSIYLGINNLYSCSIFTNKVSFNQINLISKITDLCILFFDGDEQGIIGMYNTKNIINKYINTKTFFIKNKDPDEIINLSILNEKIKFWIENS